MCNISRVVLSDIKAPGLHICHTQQTRAELLNFRKIGIQPESFTKSKILSVMSSEVFWLIGAILPLGSNWHSMKIHGSLRLVFTDHWSQLIVQAIFVQGNHILNIIVSIQSSRSELQYLLSEKAHLEMEIGRIHQRLDTMNVRILALRARHVPLDH